MLPVIAEPGLPIAGEQQGAVEIDEAAPCRPSRIAGAMASEVPTMQPTISSKPSRLGLARPWPAPR